MAEMDDALRAPPLTTPPGFALRSSRRASTLGACPPPLILGASGRNKSQFETYFDQNLHQIQARFDKLCRRQK